jgi:uncharacterized protein
MYQGFARFPGRVLIILSGADLTAQEFKDMVAESSAWRALLASQQVERYELPEASHTFSRRVWRDQVNTVTANWIKSWR